MRAVVFVVLAATIAATGCERSPAASAAVSATLVCENQNGKSVMKVVGDTLTWESGSRTDNYAVVQQDETKIVAIEKDKPSEFASDLSLDRLTGNVVWTTRISQAGRRIGVEYCADRISEKDCTSQMRSVEGGNPYVCFDKRDCLQFQQGSNVVAQHQMTCTKQAF